MGYEDIELQPTHASKARVKGAVVEVPVSASYGRSYGRKPRLERYLGFLPTFAFSFTLQASWESIAAGLLAGLLNGGPSSLVYGLMLSIAGSTALAASFGEMASIMPVAGGQYHWTADLAPVAPIFLSLMQGWITVFAWLSTVAIAPFLVAIQIQGLLILNDPTYGPERWHLTLLMFAVMLVPLVVNIFARRLLAPVEILGGIFHVIFLPAVLVPLIILAPRNPDSFVWKDFITGLSGWKNDGVVWSIGLLSVTFPLGSFDGVLHMSEEVRDAAMNIPRAMIYSTIVNGIISFGATVCILYTMGGVFGLLTSPTGSPIIQIIYQTTQSKRATTALVSLVLTNGVFASFSTTASVSRLIWAFARDNGLPFSSFFVKVSPNHKIPLRALLLVTATTLGFSLINIGSTVAFTAIISLSTLALYISYVLPIIFLLIKRFSDKPIPWGPFRLGKFGLPVNIFAVVYGIYIIIFLPFPPQLPVTAANMNYAGPVMGMVLVFAVVDWFVRGRKNFHGPTAKVAED